MKSLFNWVSLLRIRLIRARLLLSKETQLYLSKEFLTTRESSQICKQPIHYSWLMDQTDWRCLLFHIMLFGLVTNCRLWYRTYLVSGSSAFLWRSYCSPALLWRSYSAAWLLVKHVGSRPPCCPFHVPDQLSHASIDHQPKRIAISSLGIMKE